MMAMFLECDCNILVNNVNETKTILGKNHAVFGMAKLDVIRRDLQCQK